MTKKKILITAEIPKSGINFLEKNFEVVKAYGGREEIFKKIGKCDGALVLLSDTIDREIIDCGENLKCISVYAVGYNNIDLECAKERKIAVTNTPDVLTESTADLTLLLILAITRRLKEGIRMMENGEFTGWSPKLLLGRELSSMTVGVVGAGRIGEAVIRKLTPFGCRILFHNRRKKSNSGGEYATFEEIITQSDLITIHTPLTPETTHLFNGKTLRKMKPGSFIVNTSRGRVIDEKELVNLLKEHHLAGAALDVFEFEPSVTEELKYMDNVVLTPHIGSATLETREKMSMMAAENLYKVLNNLPCENIVNL